MSQLTAARRDTTGVPVRAGLVWLLLLVNVLGFQDDAFMIVPVSHSAGQVVTMGSLVMAFLLALRLNPRLRVRPNAYLLLLSALALLAVCSSLRLESGASSLLRCVRLAAFVATLWLLSRWWTGEPHFVRFHVRALAAVLALVVAGVLISPGSAFPDGRLAGTIWPMPPTQVGEFSAVLTGLVLLLWLSGTIRGRQMLLLAVPAVSLLLLSRTRTALLGLVVGLFIAVLALALSNRRARRALLVAGFLGALTVLAAGGPLLDWVGRDQTAAQMASLTGREQVWSVVAATDRVDMNRLIGAGLTDKGFVARVAVGPQPLDGNHPIDSSWWSTYQELGEVGVVLVAAMLIALLGTALLKRRLPGRAFALFLIAYCTISSYLESGLDDASPFLLHLAVAASVLLPAASGRLQQGATVEAGR